jgi:hypothetical protein
MNDTVMMTAIEQSSAPRCANCDVEIPWRPTIHGGQPYCCGGCAQGGPCYCSYDIDLTTRVWPLTADGERPRGVPAGRPLTGGKS